MWEHRNSIVHEKAQGNINSRELRVLDDMIRHEFQLGSNGVCEAEKFYFNGTINSILQKSVKDKKEWIQLIRGSRLCYELTTGNMYENMRHVMQRWLNNFNISNIDDG